MRAHLAWALARAGETEEARRRLEALDAAGHDHVRLALPAGGRALAALGDTAGWLARFEEGVEQRDPWVVFAGASPLFAPLRAEARFAELRRQVGYPS